MEVAAALTTALGLALGLVGYRLFRAALALYGFLSGCAIVAVAGADLLHGWWLVGAVVVGGLLGAMVAGLAERAAFFVVGAGLGWMLAAGAAAAAEVEWLLPVAILGGVLGGMVMLWMERPLVTFTTAAVGAWATAHGVGALVSGQPLDLSGPLPGLDGPGVALATWVGLTALFATTQWFSMRRPRDHGEAD